jgi:hypothetical protein
MPTLIKNQVYKAKKSNTVLGYRKKAKRKLKAKVFATEKQKLIKKRDNIKSARSIRSQK